MKDFHDQKLLFKWLAFIQKTSDHIPNYHINWVEAHVFVVDVFLYCLAKHGWTLQRNKSDLPFKDITERLQEFDAFLKDSQAEALGLKKGGDAT